MRSRTVAAIVTGAAVGGALLTGAAVSAATPDVTYFACLKGGALSNVGTTSPTCTKGGVVINWNSTGPQGAPGLPGVEGPAGPAGEVGATGANGVSGYFTYNFTTALSGNPDTAVVAPYTAGCPGGRVPIGGGYKYTEAVPNTVRVVGEHASVAPAMVGWQVEVEILPEGADAGSTITVYSICAFAN